MAPVRPGADENLIARIGKKIKDLRKAQKLTLKELAHRAGVSLGTISKIEKGVMVPSVVVFLKITRALKEEASFFFDNEKEPQREVQFFRAGDYKTLHNRQTGVRFKIYGPTIHSAAIDSVFYCTLLKPESGSEAPPLFHDQEEILLGTRGQIKFRAGKQEFILRKGDILFVNSNVPHGWKNLSSGPSEVFMITIKREESGAEKRTTTWGRIMGSREG